MHKVLAQCGKAKPAATEETKPAEDDPFAKPAAAPAKKPPAGKTPPAGEKPDAETAMSELMQTLQKAGITPETGLRSIAA